VCSVAEGLHGRTAASADRVHASPDRHLVPSLVDQSDRPPHQKRPLRRDTDDADILVPRHELRFRAVAFPPLRPAAFFWAVVPPWVVVLRRVPDPDFFPPREDAPGEFAIRAARAFDIPLSFNASY
jgi:hypothetical protein